MKLVLALLRAWLTERSRGRSSKPTANLTRVKTATIGLGLVELIVSDND